MPKIDPPVFFLRSLSNVSILHCSGSARSGSQSCQAQNASGNTSDSRSCALEMSAVGSEAVSLKEIATVGNVIGDNNENILVGSNPEPELEPQEEANTNKVSTLIIDNGNMYVNTEDENKGEKLQGACTPFVVKPRWR